MNPVQWTWPASFALLLLAPFLMLAIILGFPINILYLKSPLASLCLSEAMSLSRLLGCDVYVLDVEDFVYAYCFTAVMNCWSSSFLEMSALVLPSYVSPILCIQYILTQIQKGCDGEGV